MQVPLFEICDIEFIRFNEEYRAFPYKLDILMLGSTFSKSHSFQEYIGSER